MTKQELWTSVYLESIKKHNHPLVQMDRDVAAESANQALEQFEKRFPEIIKVKNAFDAPNTVLINPKDAHLLKRPETFTQLVRFKRLFEEFDIAVEFGNNEDESFVLVMDWCFYFKDEEFKHVRSI